MPLNSFSATGNKEECTQSNFPHYFATKCIDMFNLSNGERKMPGTIIRVQEGHVILKLVEIVQVIFMSCL